MEIAKQVQKPRTQRGKRALERKTPKLIENVKNSLFVKGGHTSELISSCLKEVYSIKKPNAIFMKRRNPFHPFEDETGLEKFAQKYDASLFAFGSHSKKRPDNLILGRLFDYHILDMFEMCIENFKSSETFRGTTAPLGCKPCLVFAGDEFQQDENMRRLKNLLIDFFRGEKPEKLRLQGLELLISFTAVDKKIFVKTYKLLMKKSGTKVPRVEISETGPSFDLVVRRSKVASDDLFKQACRQPKAAKVKKVKNVSQDVFGTKFGRVHVQQQSLSTLRTKKVKGLRGGDDLDIGSESATLDVEGEEIVESQSKKKRM